MKRDPACQARELFCRGNLLSAQLWAPGARRANLIINFRAAVGHPSSLGNIMKAKFELGSTYITANARNVLNPTDVMIALQRHVRGDWGDVSREDAAENELSLTAGFRILSVYHDSNQVKFWIITEADRSVTTVLLPDDY